MIASQRKAHKFIWLGLSILIAALLVLVIKDLDFSFSTLETPNGLPFEAMRSENSIVLVKLNEPLKTPSALVYEINANKELGAVLGELNGKGEYKFTLSKNAVGITVIDKIKNQKIYTTTF
ncbi:hypothetical protein [uncultured Croceitalea sp.]|uniref:hypothetical protein n=1 Tax=uncultured Croceitalea sp. TaxID=1798908 RepID=UPI003305D7A9